MSMFGNASPSLADIAAVTRNGDDGFGGNNGWWVLIILFALFGGWGNNGNGRNSNCGDSCSNGTTVIAVPTGGYGMGGGYSGFESAALQRGFDNQTVINKLDGINSGICSLGYDQLAQMNGINSNVTQTGFAIQQAVNSGTVAGMQNANALSAQMADCCCKTQTGFMNVINQMDKNACALNNNVHMTGDAIIQNQNNGFTMLNQTVKDGFCNLEMREQQREIQRLRDEAQDQRMNNALQGMATYLINRLDPSPVPAYAVQNPNGCGCQCRNNWNNCRDRWAA